MWLRSPLLPGSPLAQHMLPISKEESRSPPPNSSLFSLLPKTFPILSSFHPLHEAPRIPASCPCTGWAGLGLSPEPGLWVEHTFS